MAEIDVPFGQASNRKEMYNELAFDLTIEDQGSQNGKGFYPIVG